MVIVWLGGVEAENACEVGSDSGVVEVCECFECKAIGVGGNVHVFNIIEFIFWFSPLW